MLFGYPIAATAENWLHECLCEMLRGIHASLDAGGDPPAWPDIIPPALRARLQSRRGLRDRIAIYTAAVSALSQEERARVIHALNDQNDIPGLLSCAHDCVTLDGLPPSIRDCIKSLFGYAFELLTDLGIRDRQYAVIHEQIRYRVCPFCGCEYFDAPGAARQSLDHYLARSLYPFVAANLRNLPPIGNTCNARYKLSQDILRRNNGTRRRSFYPFNTIGVAISLDNSQPNDKVDGPLIATWQIDFSEDTEEVETWNDVFSIRERYKRDILSHSFQDWLWEFRNYCKSLNLIAAEDLQVIDAINRYWSYLLDCGLNDRAFLKASVFKMLLKQCREGQRRILDVMRDLVNDHCTQTS